jgi:hypothetical protein
MKNEFKILLCLACLLLLLEAGARVFETRLSKDVQHLRELPAQAEKIRTAGKDVFKVLVLGNSLARCGVDVALLTTELKQQLQREVVVAVMHPDGSRIEQWTYGYRRYFEQTGAVPDVVLLITGRLHLTDQPPDVSDMGAFYVSNKDVPVFMRSSKVGGEDAARFFAARSSALLAHADRVQPLLFYRFVPGYEGTAGRINRSKRSDSPLPPTQGLEPTCETLKFLANTLKSTGARLVIASVPMPEPYDLPGTVLGTVLGAHALLINTGRTLPLLPDLFPDHYHLDELGAEQLTKVIVSEGHGRWQ